MQIQVNGTRTIEGTRSFRLYGGYTCYFRAPFKTPSSTPSVGAWMYLNAADLFISASWGAEIRFVTTSGHYVSALWDSVDHTWEITVQGATVDTSDDTGIDALQLFNIRFYGELDNAGDLAINLNGYEIASFNGDTLPDGSDATVEYVEFRMWSDQANSQDLGNVSSISVNDGGADPGDRRIYVKMVDSDSAIQWSRSSGAANYEPLDDVPASADYVYTSTDGHIDKLGLEDVADLNNIYGVTKFVRAMKTTGDAQTLKNGVDSNGTVETTTHVLDTVLEYLWHPMEDDPDTAALWNMAGINALLAYRESVIP